MTGLPYSINATNFKKIYPHVYYGFTGCVNWVNIMYLVYNRVKVTNVRLKETSSHLLLYKVVQFLFVFCLHFLQLFRLSLIQFCLCLFANSNFTSNLQHANV